jgi:methylase of polypeptide subunit release factors
VSDSPLIRWEDNGEARVAVWRAAGEAPPPRAVVLVDDRVTADQVYGLACQGTGLLWRGDFQNARQMLLALGRRADRRARRRGSEPESPAATFNHYRQGRAQRARTLNALLVPLDAGYRIPLARAPDVRAACREAWGMAGEECIVPLRTLLGLIGAHEWRIKGLEIPAAGGRIHPHYGVFAPVRQEYVELLAAAPLPAALHPAGTAFDIGTGTGVLAAVLARRGVERVVATDLDERALACARDNIRQLGLQGQVQVERADLFPPGRAALVVCNPPWLPARPGSSLERAIYDPQSRMLRGFLGGLAAHLEPDGEGWLILSDLAEHLGLRTRDELLAAFDAAHLRVVGRDEARPRHPRAAEATDALHAARAAEMTSLWRLAPRSG